MVLYFTSNVVDPAAFIYVGKDKVENEDLIAHGWDEDVWFHADKLSSAHIYLRLPEGQTWDDISKDLLWDCAQLTKANSIEGNKKDNVNIVYTPWNNLKKDGSMAVGQVGFKDQKKVRRIMVEARANPIINRLNKTKTEKLPDLAAEKEARLKELRDRDRGKLQERRKEEQRIERERRELKYQKEHAYDDIFTEEAKEMNINQQYNSVEEYEDDFM